MPTLKAMSAASIHRTSRASPQPSTSARRALSKACSFSACDKRADGHILLLFQCTGSLIDPHLTASFAPPPLQQCAFLQSHIPRTLAAQIRISGFRRLLEVRSPQARLCLVRAHGARGGAITFIQRFGSAANLNVHLHMLIPDGGYIFHLGKPRFHALAGPHNRRQTSGAVARFDPSCLPITPVQISNNAFDSNRHTNPCVIHLPHNNAHAP